MAYSEEEIEIKFNEVIEDIENGSSLIASLSTNGMPSTSTFYLWMDADDEKSKRYARACEVRELKILDEMLEIADKQGADVTHTDSGDRINHNVIQRNSLQIETRKWLLGKLAPTKYGNKTILEGGDKPITISFED